MDGSPPPPPEALATTKRKFHKLLDNLTASKSTTSLASTLRESNTSTTSLSAPVTPEPPSKRSRLSDVSMDLGRGRTVSGERIKALQEKLFTPRKDGAGMRLVGSNKTPKKSTATPPRKPPNFQPYSQEQFLARMRTFADVKKWTTKPDAIGDVEWAKRGWSCAAWNTVACKGGCEARVVVKLRPKRKDELGKKIEMSEDMGEEVLEDLVQRYKELILEGHDEGCLWRKGGCKEDIYHIPIPNRAQSTAELLRRYHSFKPILSDLPLLDNVTYPDPPISDILPRAPSSTFNPPGSSITENPPSTPSEITAFTFALFGWSGLLESRISLVTCDHCFQRIGLWLYEEKRIKEMSKKLDVDAAHLGLNLVEAHREHCPWKNGVAQANPKDSILKDMAGWQTLEFMLLGKRKDEPRAGVESMDLGRGSMDSMAESTTGKSTKSGDSITEKWKKLKSKLKRSASRKSLKSVKSLGGEKERNKENV
ncbi:zf-C3HC-domain-containing protein [Lindgomyces ingoldianus]|uniref:Zf-C3HC-domain-containing protein n=1 Tax=Lindgomyces ingoldianus TaxID=673940 RepID=A0ACB6QNI4_9PLEO|nr:zf-C3HC-domain-containing protein [Lindgomyces ingoldianus]KAF2468553.1 zf-C3HC-domain-containing protein [Lindgomyces ingoldianus]